jgi:hypothetical protein
MQRRRASKAWESPLPKPTGKAGQRVGWKGRMAAAGEGFFISVKMRTRRFRGKPF